VIAIAILFLYLPVGVSAITLQEYSQVKVAQYAPASPEMLATFSAAGSGPVRSEDGALWRKGERGLIRELSAGPAWDKLRTFHSKRFLPCDEVSKLRAEGNGVWVLTSCGVSHISFENIRLEEKARRFEERVRARHDRYGMVADSLLRPPGDLAKNQLWSNDNDGLWTAMYVAAKLFEYKQTQDARALAAAEKSIRAVLYLEKITGIAGFPARSYRLAGEERPTDGFWYWSPDKKLEWKADTSSDEIVGHFLVFALAWDYLPKGALREDVRATCGRMMDYILKNGYNLIDVTGKPTRWGRWSLEYFNGVGRADSPLNALELVSFLRTAHHVTGEAKYEQELKKLEQAGYFQILTEVKEREEELNYSDEELAMLSLYPALLYEKNPKYRAALLKSLDGWWVNTQREKSPLWIAIYALGRPVSDEVLRDGVRTLQRMPMDLVNWRVENSWRKDLPVVDKKDRAGHSETTVLLAPDERAVMKWNANPFVLDGGNGGHSEDDGAAFLLGYWIGRHHGFWRER
jgi:hypothetical protein